MKTVAVIGGGFSGTMTAVNLARFSEGPLRIVVVNRGFPTGRGAAYGTKRLEHLLNVAARNMSAFPDHPQHFVEWLATRAEYAETPEPVLRELFVPRRIYGDYLRSLLFAHARPTGGRDAAKIEIVEGEAVDVIAHEHGGTVVLADGDRLVADRIVLATGNQPPADIATGTSPFRHPRYCETPWVDWEGRLPDTRENVVLLGTGLTMIDAFLTLTSHEWQGTIFAVSRNGLLPQSHFRGIEYLDFPAGDPSTLGLAQLVEIVEDHCGRLRRLGADPAIVIDKFRPHTQRIWQNLSLADKRDFCTRYAGRWNVTRHRVAQEIHQRVAAALADGRLRIVKGRIAALDPAGTRVKVTVEDTSGSRLQLEGGLVINCTGPQLGFAGSATPLFQSLLRRGLVAVDELDMGLKVGADFSAIDGAGNPSTLLLAMGPLLKGTLWETTAVPELRGQALRIAERLVDELMPEEPRRRHAPVRTEVELLEYCI